jgi:hypothetical protein
MSVDRQEDEARHGPWRQSHSPSIPEQRSATAASDRNSKPLSHVFENGTAGKQVRGVRPCVGRSSHVPEVAPHQPRIASRSQGDWLRHDVQQASSSSSSAAVRVHEQVQDGCVAREGPSVLTSTRGVSAALTHRDSKSDSDTHAAVINVEGQEAQVQVQAGKQRSSALGKGKRRVRAGGSSLVCETLATLTRPRDVVHITIQNNLVGQQDDSAGLHKTTVPGCTR